MFVRFKKFLESADMFGSGTPDQQALDQAMRSAGDDIKSSVASGFGVPQLKNYISDVSVLRTGSSNMNDYSFIEVEVGFKVSNQAYFNKVLGMAASTPMFAVEG